MFSINKISILLFITTIICISAQQTATAQESATLANTLQIKAEQQRNIWDPKTYRNAITLFTDASRNWQVSGNHQKAAHCLRMAAELNLALSDRRSALSALNAALKIDRENFLAEGEVLDLSLLSHVYDMDNNIAESKAFFEKALELSKSNPTNTGRAYALLAAGEYHFLHVNVRAAQKLFENALEYAENIPDPDLNARIQINLSVTLATSGQREESLNRVGEAARNFEQAGNRRGLAQALNARGFIHIIYDEKQKALDSYQQALALFPEDIDLLEHAKSIAGIASIYSEYGETTLSEKYWREAYNLNVRAAYQMGQLAILPELAKSAYARDGKSSSDNFLAKAIELSLKPGNEIFGAYLKIELAEIDFRNGAFAAAVEKNKEALAIYENFGLQNPSIINNIGKATEKTGDLGLARSYYESALEKNNQIRNSQGSAESLYDLARLDLLDGSIESALELSGKSVNITETIYYDVLNTNLRSSFMSSVYDRYELHINLLMAMNSRSPSSGYDVLALQTAEKARSRSIREMISLTGANFTKDADPNLVKREKEILFQLNSNANQLTDLLNSRAPKNEIDEADSEISHLQDELEQIKSTLKQKSPIYSEIENPTPFNVQDFQKTVLDDNTLLLEFSLGTRESYLWVIGRNEINSYKLPPREEIEGDVLALRELLARGDLKKDETLEDFRKREIDEETNYWRIAQKLSDTLFGPIGDQLSDQKLIVVPDGKLALFPVAALPAPGKSSSEPLVLNHEIIYEPSAAALSLILSIQTENRNAGKKLLVLSDPVFQADDGRLSDGADGNKTFRGTTSLSDLSRLESSKIEAAAIIDIVGKGQADLFEGFAANRDQFFQTNLSEYQILHFATHGLVDENRPELSGLVLSRFNKQRERLKELISLQDIYSLKLNADLVVLSACDTGIGKEVKGEGLISLNNAFLQVGARTVISSFWKVEDTATVEFMKWFYGNLDSGMTASKALQQAQIRMWESNRFRSPFYWAAFNVQGDFRKNSVLKSESAYKIPLFLFVLSALFGAGLWYYFRRKSLRKK